MIVTVTPAPAIDWTIEVDSFELGTVNRAGESSREPSGKGVNISWALHQANRPTRALLLAGGDGGKLIDQAMVEAGIEHVITNTECDVRTNITLITPDNSTKINEAVKPVSAQHLAQFRESVITASKDATAILICGSIPSGVPAEFVRDVVEEVRMTHGDHVEIVVDTSGDPLALALQAHPDLIKPNVHELADLVGVPIETLGEVVAAAQVAIAKGARAVLASLGSDGAVLVDSEGSLHAKAQGVLVVNSVGAGDALLAGYFGGGRTREERLAMAVLWASSAVAHRTTLFSVLPELVSKISVNELSEPARCLSETSVALTRGRR